MYPAAKGAVSPRRNLLQGLHATHLTRRYRYATTKAPVLNADTISLKRGKFNEQLHPLRTLHYIVAFAYDSDLFVFFKILDKR